MLPIRNFVSGVAGTCCSRSAKPNPSLQITRPCFMTVIEAPGAPRACIVSRMNRRAVAIAPAYSRAAGATAAVGACAWAVCRATSGTVTRASIRVNRIG